MTAKIVTVFNQKGGCAKTMTTMQLAGTIGLRGLKVFVVDMDPQNTAALWFHQASAEAPFPAEVLSMAPLKEAFLEKLSAIAEKYDIIIIDCPPHWAHGCHGPHWWLPIWPSFLSCRSWTTFGLPSKQKSWCWRHVKPGPTVEETT